MSAKTKTTRYFGGGKIVPSLAEDANEYGDLTKFILLVYDVPSENIKREGVSEEVKRTLHSKRNRFYYWLKRHAKAARISDSEWLLYDNDVLLGTLEKEWINPMSDFYDLHDLEFVFSWYPMWTTKAGVETIKAQVLKNLSKNIESLQRTITIHMDWHENFMRPPAELRALMDIDNSTKAVKLILSKITTWKKKFEGYDEVLKDFIDKKTIKDAKMTRQNITDQLSAIKLMIEKCKELAVAASKKDKDGIA